MGQDTKNDEDGSPKNSQLMMLFLNILMFVIFVYLLVFSLQWLLDGVQQYMEFHNFYRFPGRVMMAAEMPSVSFFDNVIFRSVTTILFTVIVTKICNSLVECLWAYFKGFLRWLCKIHKRKR